MATINDVEQALPTITSALNGEAVPARATDSILPYRVRVDGSTVAAFDDNASMLQHADMILNRMAANGVQSPVVELQFSMAVI